MSKSDQPYQVAIVQATGTNGDVSGNLERMKSIVEKTKAGASEVKLVLFPELAVTGYYLAPEIASHAEPADGEAARYLGEAAKACGTYIAYGYVESGTDGKTYNSLQLIDSAGQPVANYRKIHLTDLERDVYTPGNELVVADTELGKIGLMICWDLAFPELARSLAVRGADLLLAPAAWEKPYDDPFLLFAMARAIDNTVYLATCNQIGTSGDLAFFGKSGLYGPDGESIAVAETDEEQVIVGEIDFAHRDRVRSTFFTMLQERRKDLYGLKEEVESANV